MARTAKRKTGSTRKRPVQARKRSRSPENKLWAWLSKRKNRTTLAFIGGGLAVVVAAGWQAYVYFSPQETVQPTPSQVTATGGGIAAGGDVTATAPPGGTAVIVECVVEVAEG